MQLQLFGHSSHGILQGQDCSSSSAKHPQQVSLTAMTIFQVFGRFLVFPLPVLARRTKWHSGKASFVMSHVSEAVEMARARVLCVPPVM
jgi:hypothetical protein